MKLFEPDPETGTLGYVKHSYNRSNYYQLVGNFFIGIGPILLGTVIIFLLSYWLLGLNFFNLGRDFSSMTSQLNSWGAFRDLLQSLWNSSGHLLAEIFSWQYLLSWHLYAFIYLVFAVGSSVTLSQPDIKSAVSGFIVIVILIFIFNLATVWRENYMSNFVTGLEGYYVLFYTIIFLILLTNIVVGLLVFIPLSLLRSRHSNAV
jgi:hypothetical protein